MYIPKIHIVVDTQKMNNTHTEKIHEKKKEEWMGRKVNKKKKTGSTHLN